jgi:hypothetical protein
MKTLASLYVLICFASTALAGGPVKTVPEVLSPLWLALPVAGMIAVRYIRSKKS